MINEDITQKDINIAVRVGSLAISEIRKKLEKLSNDSGVNKSKQPKISQKSKKPSLKHGKQTLKQLQKHNDGLSTVELKDPNLRQLYRAMKKDGVDFSILKDGKGKYTLFFKAKDVDTITHALKRYTQKIIRLDTGKPAINKALTAAKELAKALETGRDKEKNKSKGAIER